MISSFRITSNRFRELADEINQIFLHEKPEIYYVSYVKNPGGHPKAAGGKLWGTYNYMRRNFRKFGLISSSSKNRTETGSVDHAEGFADVEGTYYFLYYGESTTCIYKIFAEDLKWLKNNSQPFTLVQEKWRNTTQARTDQFPETISAYFKLYNVLNNPLGYLLLETDFNNVYPGKENYLINKWNNIYKLILKLSENSSCKFLKDILVRHKQQYARDVVGDCNEGTYFLLYFIKLYLTIYINFR